LERELINAGKGEITPMRISERNISLLTFKLIIKVKKASNRFPKASNIIIKYPKLGSDEYIVNEVPVRIIEKVRIVDKPIFLVEFKIVVLNQT